MDPNIQNPNQTPPNEPNPQTSLPNQFVPQSPVIPNQVPKEPLDHPPLEQSGAGGNFPGAMQSQNTTLAGGMVSPLAPGVNIQNVNKRRFSARFATKLLIILIAIFALIGAVIFILSALGRGPKKYSTADLVTEKLPNVSFSRPKSWVDGKDIDSIKSAFNSELNFHDPVAFADAVVKDKDGKMQPKFVYVVVAKANSGTGLTNEQLQEFIATSELKSQFEQEVNAGFTAEDLKSENECENVENLEHNIVYAGNFQITLNMEADCIYSSEKQKEIGTKSAHLLVSVGLQQSDSYIMAIAAKKKSWDINQELYRKMISDFKAN